MIEVLRLSHRLRRDPRLSTHVALTARAFLADKIYYSGQHDSSLEDSINKVTKEFGGNFKIEYITSSLKLIKEKKKENYLIIHLTVYGLKLKEVIKEIKKSKNILIIVGGEKVPIEIYKLSDYNISITSQPISEVSALAILLHEFNEKKELDYDFKEAKIKIIPQERCKKIINRDKQ